MRPMRFETLQTSYQGLTVLSIHIDTSLSHAGKINSFIVLFQITLLSIVKYFLLVFSVFAWFLCWITGLLLSLTFIFFFCLTVPLILDPKGSCHKHIQGGGPSISRPSAAKYCPPLIYQPNLYTPPKKSDFHLDPP